MAENKPDFAFPTKVVAQSERDLARAMKRHDNRAIVSALLNECIAANLLDNSKAGQLVVKIDSVISLSTEPSLKAMLNILNARLLQEIYNANRSVFDQRNLPDTPVPDDLLLWSGKQMRDRIMTCVIAATTDVATLSATPLSDYDKVVTIGKNERVLYPTLFDFTATLGIDIINSIRSNAGLYNWRYLLPGKEFVKLRLNPTSIYARAVLNLYARLLEIHLHDIPAYINSDISRLEFVNSNLIVDGDNEKQYLTSLYSLYDHYRDNEYSALPLIEIKSSDYYGHYLSDTEWVRILRDYLLRFPDGIFYPMVNQMLASVTCKSVEVSAKNIVPLSPSSDIKVRLKNVASASVSIYNVTGLSDEDARNTYPSLLPIANLPIGSTREVPFSEEKTLHYSFPGFGKYLIVPSFDGATVNNPLIVTVSSLIPVIRSSGIENSILLIDRVTGEGVKDVALYELTRDGSRQSSRLIGMTDSLGYMNFTSKSRSQNIIACHKGDDRYGEPVRFYTSDRQNTKRARAEFFTSLPLYHPGDSLDWAAVAYENDNGAGEVLTGTEVSVTLLDANRQPVDTLMAVTDNYGRVSGAFIIPKDRLTGFYSLTMTRDGKHIKTSRIMVSDYVAPEFRITMRPVENDAPVKGDVTVRGNVSTYSGFNLGSSSVEVKVISLPPFYYVRYLDNNYESFYDATVETDASGNFTLVIPQSVLDDAPVPDGVFYLKVTATSPSGESQETMASFLRSPSYHIDVNIDQSTVEAPAPLKVKVSVKNFDNETVDIPVLYSVATENDTVINNAPVPADGLIPTSAIPSGQYRIIFSITDENLAKDKSKEIIIYRADDTRSPVSSQMVWSPDGRAITLDKSRRLSWRFAIDEPMIIHYCVATDSGITDTGKFTGRPGMNEWHYAMPDGVEKCEVSLFTSKNNEQYSITLSLIAPPSVAPIRIKAESFRDRVTSGSAENWKFYVVDTGDIPRQSAVMMRMYNAALDAVNSAPWVFPSFSSDIPFYVNYSFPINNCSTASENCIKSWYASRFTTAPSFNTFGYSLYSYARPMLRMYKSAYTSAGNSDSVNLSETIEEEAKVMEMSDDAGVPVMGLGSASSESFNSGSVTDTDSENTFSYRDAEVAGALFRPMLATDPDGRLTVRFTLPDANTTWRLNILAFTKALDKSTFDASVIASKPVMVSPQVPTFLRRGDKACVKAIVMNNSDTPLAVTTNIEFFNPADGKTISCTGSTDTIPAGASSTASATIDCDIEAEAIGYRIISSTDTFADGEAGLIPLLPSAVPVIESMPFYISPTQHELEISLPSTGNGSEVSMQFTGTPAWYVAAALPGLITDDNSSAIGAATSVFSAAVATGLLRDNPAMASDLRDWLESNRSDSTYLSMLERNPDLKIMLLNSTPWMLEAASDVERMTRLALLFDKAETDRVIGNNIKVLVSLIKPDGGLGWMNGSETSSEWATATTLMLMGRLNALGYLPADSSLGALIDNALLFIEDKAGERLIKYPDSSFSTLTYILSLFPRHTISDLSRIAVDNTVKSMTSTWKEHSVADKAAYALILNRLGHKDVARYIMESIMDFASAAPHEGMWWPSIGQSGYDWNLNKIAATARILEATAEIMPASDNIEKIRQWIVLQKQATDWRNPVSTSSIIADVLSSSPATLRPTGDVKITIDGKELIPENVENSTGYFRVDISPLIQHGSTLRITRSDAAQSSWGSIITRSLADLTDITATSIDGISISKKILRYNGSAVEETPELAVGDKVSVQLTIITDRDMDYVAIDDLRSASMQPVEQLPRRIYAQGLPFYLEPRRDCTRMFVDHLPSGKYILSYDMYVTNSGTYTTGMATLQSQYAPELTAHSASERLTVKP